MAGPAAPDPVALTLGNSEMIGVAITELFITVHQRIDASRVLTLKSDDDTQAEMELLERREQRSNHTQAFLSNVWNQNAGKNRGALVILAGITASTS